MKQRLSGNAYIRRVTRMEKPILFSESYEAKELKL